MISIIDELKVHARRLHRAAATRDPAALARLGVDDASGLQRRHCLAAIARARLYGKLIAARYGSQ